MTAKEINNNISHNFRKNTPNVSRRNLPQIPQSSGLGTTLVNADQDPDNAPNGSPLPVA